MKFKNNFLIITAFALSFGACKGYFGNTNVNPDDTLAAGANTTLTPVETSLSYTLNGDFARFGSIFDQHIDGNNRQFAGFQLYQFTGGDFNTMWDNMYLDCGSNLKAMEAITDARGANGYSGIARILEAQTMMTLSDFFGDVPYSQAFQGLKTTQPTYDAQSAIYTNVFQLLTDGRAKLALTVGAPAPGADDVIYAGSLAKWTKYANVLAARAYLHLGKVDAGNYAKALAELNKGGFASSAEDGRFTYLNTSTGAAPMYQYLTQRGDAENGANFKALLTSLSDPRLATYGSSFFDAKGAIIHPIYKVLNQAVPMVTYTEQKFIEAECKFRGNDLVGALAAYQAGIKASIIESGGKAADADTYIATTKVTPITGIGLNEIMTQKYIAMYMQTEAYLDWRRTGIPALKPNTGTAIPRRLLYPQSEVNYNPNTPKGLTIFDRVFNDKQLMVNG